MLEIYSLNYCTTVRSLHRNYRNMLCKNGEKTRSTEVYERVLAHEDAAAHLVLERPPLVVVHALR